MPTLSRSSVSDGSTSVVTRSMLPLAAVTRTRFAQPFGNKADSNHKLVMYPVTPASAFAILSR